MRLARLTGAALREELARSPALGGRVRGRRVEVTVGALATGAGAEPEVAREIAASVCRVLLEREER